MDSVQSGKGAALEKLVRLQQAAKDTHTNAIKVSNARNAAAYEANLAGVSVAHMAKVLGIGERRVYKMVEKARPTTKDHSNHGYLK